ncbi:DUF551 domain-containing protein [Enterobacter hormaechei]|nr:DUF551 domain-containing protein [Enterobacter hormaechei]MCO6609981.1 DUF551 domain-containing protein [Enterobacter hormaechei]MCO6623175.1 DUF551 domain-containing protein [Enterobacter hormaechei]MCO6627950.1 DUF551 domain-containing protein [Enterobacter hormaechei]MCO6636425.1 DUF551 domain-containing protein [Enterobacter hormaechei]
MLIAVDAMRRLLASLEAEQVGCDACGGNGSVDIDHGEMGIEHIECPKCYAAPPAPVAVPECFKRLLHHAYGMTMGHDWNKGTMAGHHRAKLCQAVDECRAAMLQGADGNSPEIPDGWVACSERIPETMVSVLVTGTWFHHAVAFWDGLSWCDLDFEQPVTHWMPLPAAPQQEVK